MKGFWLIALILVAAFAVSSCGKDDGNSRPGDKGTFTLQGSGTSS